MEEEEGHPTSPEGGAGAQNVLSSVVFLLRCLQLKSKSIIEIKRDEPHVLDSLDPARATPTYLSEQISGTSVVLELLVYANVGRLIGAQELSHQLCSAFSHSSQAAY